MPDYTVKQLLENNSLKGLRVAAGEEYLDNKISGVNIMDNPDTYDWLAAGDFLMTTGYIFKDDPDLQLQIIRELAEINCSGIGIKVKRYLDAVPPEMAREADRYGLPIVEIPYHLSLAKVSSVIENEIARRKDTMLEKLIHIHNTLNQCVLEGGSLDEIAKLVSTLINNPIIIVDSRWRLLSYADHPNNPIRLEDHLYLSKKELVFPPAFLEGVPRNIDQFTKSIKRRYPDAEGDITCRLMPVAADKTIYGYLVAWETVQKMTSIGYMALESAATTVALERIKSKQIEEIKHHLRKDFFDDLLHGKIESVHAVNSLAEIHYMDAGKQYVCMVTRIRQSEETANTDTAEKKDLFLQLKRKLINQIDAVAFAWKKNVISIHRGNLLISFILMSENEKKHRGSLYLSDFVNEIHASLSKLHGSLDIGVGEPCLDFFQMHKSYMQAREANRISAQIGQEGCVSFYESLLVYHLLDSVPKVILEEFAQYAVGLLLEYDRKNCTNLVETLEQYFECGGNVSIAAKKMFLHRNTLIYRVEKIEGILGIDLKETQTVFEIQLGLRIVNFLKNFHVDAAEPEGGRKDRRR